MRTFSSETEDAFLSEAAPVSGMAKSIFRRLGFLVLIACLVLAAPAGVMAYRFYTSRPDYLTKKGREALERGNLTEAHQLADLLEKKGYNSAAHLLRGQTYLHQAKEELEKAPVPFPFEGMQQASQMVMSSAGLGAISPTLRGPVWKSLVLFQRSLPRRLTGADHLLDALGEFTEVMDEDPRAAEATMLGSECLVRLGDHRSAELALASLVKRQPDNLEGHRWLAAIYVDLNATVPALTHLEEWIRLDPQDPRPYRLFCLIMRDTEEGYPEAIEGYRKLLQLDLKPGERATVLKDLAETQIAVADYLHALETLAEVPGVFQNRPAILLLRADCLQGLSKPNEARIIVDDVLKEYPNLAKALLFRAKMYLQENQPRPAIALLEKLVSRHPYHHEARLSLMIAYRTVGDDRRAAEQKQIVDILQEVRTRLMELKPVTVKNPWNGPARLEAALLNSGINYSEALAWIRFALASSPEDPRIRKAWVQLVGYQPPPLLRDFQRRRQRKADNQ